MTSTIDFTLSPEHMATRYNLETPIFDCMDCNGDWNYHLRQIRIRIPYEVANDSNPLVELQFHVDIPLYVQSEIRKIAEIMTLRHMVAESLCPDEPTSID